MENIILGLLMLQSRTIYELRKRINDGLNLMYSCSMVSIQAAIKKLLKNGLISVNETKQNGKLKKIYSITPPQQKKKKQKNAAAKNPELSKIYFLGFTEKEARIKLIENYISELKEVRFNLEKICNEGQKLSSENKNNDIFYFQLQTATYGCDLIKFNIDWYNKLLKRIKE